MSTVTVNKFKQIHLINTTCSHICRKLKIITTTDSNNQIEADATSVEIVL